MQRVDFHGGEVQVVHHLGGFFKIVQCLTGQPDNHVCGDGETRRLAALDGVFKFGERVPAVYGRERKVVCRLESDFYDNRLLAVHLGEVFNLLVLEAVGARPYRESGDFFVLDNRVDYFAQVLKRCVRVCVRLQVGEDACMRVLFAELRHEGVELFLDRDLRLVEHRAKTAVVAVAATRESLGAVEVRAAHAAVQRELSHLEVVREQPEEQIAVGCVVHSLKVINN